jgi:acyl carrier protein
MKKEDIGKTVTEFIHKNFIFEDGKTVGANESLLGSGVIDSTGILEMINFLEETYKIKFEDNELIAENFDTVGKIESFISMKLDHTR